MKTVKLILNVCLLVIFLLSINSNIVCAQVDADLELVEGSLDFSGPSEPNFNVGEKIKIVVTVKNTGTKKLYPVDVEFWADENVIGEVSLDELLPGEQKLAVIFWIPAAEVQYHIHAVADPRRLFDERDEGNNRVDGSIRIGAAND